MRTDSVRAICPGPFANLEPPAVGQLHEAIAATISQCVNTHVERMNAPNG